MIIKNKDNNQESIDYLSDLLDRDFSDDKKSLIEREIKNLHSGNDDEETSAYYLDSYFSQSKNIALIHDLRIEHAGESVHIDHLIIGRMMEVYVIDSKNFNYGVAVSEEGGFSYFYNNQTYPISSPITQNQRRIKLLNKFLNDKELLPKRLGITLQPEYKNIVLISPQSTLAKPQKGLFDCSAVMKIDKFTERFKHELNSDDAVKNISNLAKVISQDSLQRFAEKIVLSHKPVTVNYIEKFALKDEGNITGKSIGDITGLPTCPLCGSEMVRREAKKGKTAGKEFLGCTQFPKCKGVLSLEKSVAAEEPKPLVVNNVDADNNSPLCPKCNGAMVKRTSKKGKNAGNEFWGCLNFPKCKGVVSIDNT